MESEKGHLESRVETHDSRDIRRSGTKGATETMTLFSRTTRQVNPFVSLSFKVTFILQQTISHEVAVPCTIVLFPCCWLSHLPCHDVQSQSLTRSFTLFLPENCFVWTELTECVSCLMIMCLSLFSSLGKKKLPLLLLLSLNSRSCLPVLFFSDH
jgi:hypothetical protein